LKNFLDKYILSHKDQETWDLFAKTIQKINKNTPKTPKIKEDLSEVSRYKRNKSLLEKSEKLNKNKSLKISISKDLESDKNKIVDIIDLHGYTIELAHKHLLVKLRNKGTYLIITGKSGILREDVPRWLTKGLISQHISCQIKSIELGAIYVTIK
jgi:DNA-nicking Smr family endonuclease